MALSLEAVVMLNKGGFDSGLTGMGYEAGFLWLFSDSFGTGWEAGFR